MNRLRRIHGLPFATLSVFFASVFFLGTTVYAQSPIEVRPLSVNEQIILEQSQQVEEKSTVLKAAAEELRALEEKKKALAEQLNSEKEKIEQLKIQIENKKAKQAREEAARAEAARVRAVSTAPVAVSSGGGLRSNCGDNYYAAYIYAQESGGRVVGMCNPSAVNAGGCRGIGQACPGSKLPCGADYACQNAWFTSYMQGRYGSWAAAYNFHRANNWW